MTQLKKLRETLNITQKELAEKTNISLRTIQRIEAGQPPKGHTLKTLANALQVEEKELLGTTEKQGNNLNHWVNISALPCMFLPPSNILLPLIIMFLSKTFNPVTKQIVTLQIVWTVLMVILVVTSAMIRNAYFLSDTIPPVTLGLCMLLNIFIILRNAMEISRHQKLYIKL